MSKRNGNGVVLALPTREQREKQAQMAREREMQAYQDRFTDAVTGAAVALYPHVGDTVAAVRKARRLVIQAWAENAPTPEEFAQAHQEAGRHELAADLRAQIEALRNAKK